MDDSPTTETLVVSKQKHNKENDTLQSRKVNLADFLSSNVNPTSKYWSRQKTQMH